MNIELLKASLVEQIAEDTDLSQDELNDSITFEREVRQDGETWASFLWIEEDGHDTILCRFDIIKGFVLAD